LYPTVGLQTPGEVIDANFGQQPFVFDIDDMMKELGAKTKLRIQNYPIPDVYRNWEGIMNKCAILFFFGTLCSMAILIKRLFYRFL